MEHIFSQKLGIWGFGVVGQSVLRFARMRGCESITIVDAKENAQSYIPESDRPFVQFFVQTSETIHAMLETCDFIIPSPGVDLRNYQDYKQKFVAELDIFQHYTTTPTIAITGSVGKTTLTTLLGSLLEKTGVSNKTAGNIGNGMLDLISERNTANYSILEVSSFQLEHIKQFAPFIAIISNIYPNHLDRHETMQSYTQAKLRMLQLQKESDYSIVPWELRELLIDKEQFPAQKLWHYPHEISAGFIKEYVSSEPLYTVYQGCIIAVIHGTMRQIIPISQLAEVSLVANWIALIATLEALNIDVSQLISQDMQLTIPKHRIEHIGTYHGIPFYNDSKATIPAATLAAVEKLNAQQLILFIGGVSKGVDRAPFFKSLEGKVKYLYCFGREANQLTQYAQSNNISADAFENLEHAIKQYATLAERGDCVLFSPAGASFDLFENYKKRGEVFKALVQQAFENLGRLR